MSHSPLREVIDNLRSRLQMELEAELATLADSHDRALDEARRAAEAESEQRWAAKLESVREDWDTRLQAEVAAARGEVERQMVADAMRTRIDAEQAAAETNAALRREMQQAVAEERARTAAQAAAIEAERLRVAARSAEIEAERTRAAARVAEIEADRKRAERELADARAALDAERARGAEAVEQARRATPSIDATRLMSALRSIDSAASLTEAIAAAVKGAAAEAPRVTFFVVNGAQLDEWHVPGVPSISPMSMRVDGREAGFLAEVLRRGEPMATGVGAPPPAFAVLTQGRCAFAVPFVFVGEPVAVLYADEGTGEAAAGWTDAVQLIGRYASATAAAITAKRTVDATRLVQGVPASTASASSSSDDAEQGARRYARLLVSEIKLYNEAAVRTGRQNRDLMQRLKPEIDRARHLFDERVSPGITARDACFEQELVQTLADGDPSLLG
jgi:hypothetical protein